MGADNGTATPSVTAPDTIELETKVARYRTALFALVALAKREGWHRQITDEMLLDEIEWLLASDGAKRK